MYEIAIKEEITTTTLKTYHVRLNIDTTETFEFIDLTSEIEKIVSRSGIRDGMVNVQTRHTTATIIINENEPLLLTDLVSTLERLAPRHGEYEHDDHSRRVDIPADEPINGHSHCKSLFLPAHVTVNIADGVLQLGKWQSIFFVELDSSRERAVSVMVMGSE